MRLRKRREFLAVQSAGAKIHGKHFFAMVVRRPETGSPGRVGFTVSKKVGNAVTRNRIKRLLREAVRQGRWLPPGCDLVVVAKPSASAVAGLRDVASDLERVRGRLPC
jgi:ribonuclease P protein component